MNWSGFGTYFCNGDPFGCFRELSGGQQTEAIGPFVADDPEWQTLGASQVSNIDSDEMTGSGLISSWGINVLSGQTTASSLSSVTFQIDQPHQYHLVASSQFRLGDDKALPIMTDELLLIGSDFGGWTRKEVVSWGINGGADYFWEADQAGVLSVGEYTFVANFESTVPLIFDRSDFIGGNRTFNYSLTLTAVPEPGSFALCSPIGVGMVSIVRRQARLRRRV